MQNHNNRLSKKDDVQKMFTQIAGRYDLMNRIMTLGQDGRWRRCVIKWTNLGNESRLLDLGTGTGDLAFQALEYHPKIQITAADFTINMMKIGKTKPLASKVNWICADALFLPFKNESFDAIVSGYLIRNVDDPLKAFQEQLRVLKKGAWMVCLDTAPLKKNWLTPFIKFYLKFVIPVLGKWIAKNKSAYKYLPESTMEFMDPATLSRCMESAGFIGVKYRSYMFGTQTVIAGKKIN